MTTKTITLNKKISTCGNGLWSREKAEVLVTNLELITYAWADDFGELRTFFDTATWNVDNYGLIYTDSLFEKTLRAMLTDLGIESAKVSYSEAGMQGDNYVSFDVDGEFIRSFSEYADTAAVA